MYDQDTVKRVIEGDMDAFSVMYNELSSTVYRRIYDIVQDHAKAREAVRNVFLDIHRHCPQLRDSSLFDEWLDNLIQFHSGQRVQEEAMQNNPDLQLVWNDITATIASSIQMEDDQTMNEQNTDETVEENDVLRLSTRSIQEDVYNAEPQIIVYDDDLDLTTNHIVEILDDDQPIKIKQDDDINLEKRAELEERFPGVDFEVAKLIDQLRTEEWSPILFPPEDGDDMPKKSINELPWIHDNIINADSRKETSVDLDDIDALLDEMEDSLRAARIENENKDQDENSDADLIIDNGDINTETDQLLIEAEFIEENSVQISDSLTDVVQGVSDGITDAESVTIDEEKVDAQPIENIMYFPGNSNLMDQTAVERDDPPEWLKSGPLPNIDEASIVAKLDNVSNDAQTINHTAEIIVGTAALQTEPEPMILTDEVEEELKEDNLESKKISNDIKDETVSNAKKPQVFFETANVEIDQVNSSISYERVPYEYVPYEEASQAMYDRLNEEYERQASEDRSKNKESIYQGNNTKENESSYQLKETVPDMESVTVPTQKKKKKSGAAVAIVVALIVIIGGAIVYAKTAGLI